MSDVCVRTRTIWFISTSIDCYDDIVWEAEEEEGDKSLSQAMFDSPCSIVLVKWIYVLDNLGEEFPFFFLLVSSVQHTMNSSSEPMELFVPWQGWLFNKLFATGFVIGFFSLSFFDCYSLYAVTPNAWNTSFMKFFFSSLSPSLQQYITVKRKHAIPTVICRFFLSPSISGRVLQ